MSKNVLIGVAWPYVNGDIHIGHLAGYLFPADIYARYRRFKGDSVLMVSGSDCYGTPITVEADKRGISYQELVDEYHPIHYDFFCKELRISFDTFTKTTTTNHKKVVQDFFRKGLESGVIFIDSSLQFYDSSVNKFLPDRYVEGECPACGYKDSRSDQCDNCGRVHNPEDLISPRSRTTNKPVSLKKTQHYYYDWTLGEEFLRDYVSKHNKNWRKWSIAETNKWLKEGLKPRAITRDIDWGIDIPDDIPEEFKIDNSSQKKIYVWFEAVLGYLSASIEHTSEYHKWWKSTESELCFFMGKDNLVFHTLFLPYQLHQYDPTLRLPTDVIVNNFLNVENQKISKSRGNSIDSKEFVKKYGLEIAKFYLTSIMPENNDSNFMQEDFEEKVNSTLAGNLGNFVMRSGKLLQKVSHTYDFSTSPSTEVLEHIDRILREADTHLSKFEFKKYLESIFELSSLGNKVLQVNEPWKISEQNQFDSIMGTIIPFLVALEIITKPIFMDSSDKIALMTGITTTQWPENFVQYYMSIVPQIKLNIQILTPLFPKIQHHTD